MNGKYRFRDVLRDNGWIAATCATVGVFVITRGYQTIGVVLLAIAMLLVVLGLLALVANPFAVVSRKIGLFLRGAVTLVLLVFGGIASWLKAAYSHALKFLLAPVLSGLGESISSLQSKASALEQQLSGLPNSWIAEGVGHDGTCYQSHVSAERPVTRISFKISPDYQFPAWSAGFALTESTQENPFWKGLRFHIEFDGIGYQPRVKFMDEGRLVADSILQVFSFPKPSYSICVALWQEQSQTDFQVIVWVDGEHKLGPLTFGKPLPKVVSLLAWSDSGNKFRVSFEDVSLSWAVRWRTV